MPDLPDQPAEWPHQLRAAGALALIGIVWLLVLPVAATAYAGLELAARIRGAAKSGRSDRPNLDACPPLESVRPPIRRQM